MEEASISFPFDPKPSLSFKELDVIVDANVQEMRFQGFPVSEGIAIGPAFFMHSEERKIPCFPIAVTEVDSEITRYRHALFSSREDLKRIQKDLELEGSA